MQDFNVLRPEGYLSDDRQTINDNFESIITDFSGTVFPTNNLFAGMKCNRIDQKKVYMLQDNLTTWTYMFSYDNNTVTVPRATAAMSATNDGRSQQIDSTYIKGISQKGGASATLSITKGDGTESDLKLSLSKADVGLNQVDNIPDAEKSVKHADNATKAEQDSKGVAIDAGSYAKSVDIGMWQPNESVTVDTVRFLSGAKYAGYFLRCTTAGTTGSTEPQPTVGTGTAVNDGSVKWILYAMSTQNDINNIPSMNFNVSGSTQGAITSSINIRSGSQEAACISSVSGTLLGQVTGVSAGNYSLKNLLDALVQKSHTHVQNTPSGACNCMCADMDGTCIIFANAISNASLIPIDKLKIGDEVLTTNGYKKIVDIVDKTTEGRKCVEIYKEDKLIAIVTADHPLLYDDNGVQVYDVEGFVRENNIAYKTRLGGRAGYFLNTIPTKYGNAVQVKNKDGEDINLNIKIVDMPADTKCYLPVLENGGVMYLEDLPAYIGRRVIFA